VHQIINSGQQRYALQTEKDIVWRKNPSFSNAFTLSMMKWKNIEDGVFCKKIKQT